MRKRAAFVLFVLLWLGLPLAVRAEGTTSVPIPEALSEYFPEDIETEDAEALLDTISLSFFWKAGWKLFRAAAPDAFRTFATLLGLLLLSACLRAVKETVAMPALQTVLELTSMTCVSAAVFSVTDSLFSWIGTFLTTLSSFLTLLTPAMAALMAANGNITSAAVLSALITAALSLLEKICTGTLFSLIRFCLALSAVGALFGELAISSVVPMLKKWIAWIFGFVAFCLSAVISFQSILAKSADSVAIRSVKFAVSAFVPLVGGAVNEALTTVAGGLSTVRAATGVLGATVICLLAALPLCKILAHRFLLELLSVSAGLLGLSSEGKLVGEVASFFGYVAAILSISAVFFMLAIALMASITV